MGNTILKPRRNAYGEWEVRVMTNGRRNEARTYYTSDKGDADATFLVMQAEEGEARSDSKEGKA